MANVYISGIINLPVDKVWAYARDFNGHHEWHPIIAESHIEEGLPSDRVGCVRNFKLVRRRPSAGAAPVLQRPRPQLHLQHHRSPLPIRNYIATFTCKPVTEGDRTFVEWMADFDVAEADEGRIKEQVGRNTFAAGIAALAKKLGAKS